MKFSALTALVALTSADEQCCISCPSNLIKAFSIDPNAGHCGESCIPAHQFWLYHIFEKWLTKADSNDATPCSDHGFTEYWETETHGVPNLLAVTVDLYNTKPDAAKPLAAAPESEAMI